MRAALITREFPPETAWGGIGTYFASLARLLRDSGWEVEVFAQGLSTSSRQERDGIVVHRVLPRHLLVGKRAGGEFGGGEEALDSNGLPLGLARIGLFSASLALEMLRAFARAHGQRAFDVVEGHDHLGVGSLINLRFGSAVRTVTRYHLTYHSIVSRGFESWPRSRIVHYLEYLALKTAHCRVAPSRFVEAVTSADFPSIPPADYQIPNVCELAASPTSRVELDHKEPIVLFVGRLAARLKNPDLAASAFARIAERHPDWRIEFAGEDMPLSSTATMWQHCSALLSHLGGRFAYHGHLDRDSLASLYARARVLLVPSSIEAYGLVAVEAMANGCVPIVASDTALPDVVGEAGYVFENGSVSSLAAALDSALSDEEVLARRALAGRARVESLFHPDVLKREYLAAYTARTDPPEAGVSR